MIKHSSKRSSDIMGTHLQCRPTVILLTPADFFLYYLCYFPGNQLFVFAFIRWFIDTINLQYLYKSFKSMTTDVLKQFSVILFYEDQYPKRQKAF